MGHPQRRWIGWLSASLLSLVACKETPKESPEAPPPTSTGLASAAPSLSAPPSQPAPAPAAPPPSLTLLAGGDVSFGRLIGDLLLANPDRELFASLSPLFQSADVRFVNLEGPISDQGRETVSPENNLVFNGPPASARVLARAHIDLVATANNHAWDYGQKAMLETLDWLDKAGVQHAGTGQTLADAKKPAIIERNGFRLGMIAVTDIWNQGVLSKHPARDFVASAEKQALVDNIIAIRKETRLDALVVSYHGGVEYQEEPLQKTKEIAIAALDAGADAFLGHHPHVAQGIAFHQDKPIVYSMGNLLMRMNSAKPATEMGLLVKLVLTRSKETEIFACPVRIFGIDPIPLGLDPKRKSYEPPFLNRLVALSKRTGIVTIGAFDKDGCARVKP